MYEKGALRAPFFMLKRFVCDYFLLLQRSY